MISKSLLILSLSALAAAANAQIFEPARIYTGNTVQYPGSLQIHLCQFKADDHGAKSATTPLIAGEFALGKKGSLGFWASVDDQNDDRSSSWFEGHGTYYWRRNERSSLGVMGGLLTTEIDNFGVKSHLSWFETSLVGSCTLDTAGKTHLGATLGWGFKTKKGISDEWAHDMVTWSLSLSHYVSPQLSVDASMWSMDLQGGGSPTLNRFTVGVGFHF